MDSQTDVPKDVRVLCAIWPGIHHLLVETVGGDLSDDQISNALSRTRFIAQVAATVAKEPLT